MNMIPAQAAFSAVSLASRAMVLTLSISQWSGRALDRKVTDEVNSSHGAAADAGRYNKLLLDKAALEPIQKIVNETRTEFLKRTLPWMDGGSRIVASHAYLSHTRFFRKQQGKFQNAVDSFLSDYPSYVQQARLRLNGMFRDADYPHVDDLRRRFGFTVKVMPVPTGQDFRVDIDDDVAARIRADIESNVRDATADAVRDIYQRVAEVAERMVERLNAYRPASSKGGKAQGIFRDSLVENVRDLIRILPSLNITGDPTLDELAQRLEPLAMWDAQILRENDGKRADVAGEAQEILDSIRGFLA